MTTRFRVAAAPCSWGVNFAESPENPSWSSVLDEAAAAGYTAIDLGPIGFFPQDPERLAEELAARNLAISAGGLFDPLTVEAAFPIIINKTRRNCELLRALKAPRFVIIDDISETRGKTAGRTADAVRLGRGAWALMMKRITEVARIARDDYGVSSYLHPHAGSYIEFEDEIDRAMNDLPPDLIGLCIDTGHTAYAGMDPVSLIRRYGPRVGHAHLKSIDAKVLAACIADRTDFFGAVSRGVFSLLANGVVDFVAVRDALNSLSYSGFAVVEQDVDPKGKESPLENAKANSRFLASIGMNVSQRQRS
jgi:inosose dehydratase